MNDIRELLPNAVVKLKNDVPLIGGKEFVVEDKASKVFNSKNWMIEMCVCGNPAVIQFLGTHKYNPHYNDNRDIYYGKVGMLGYLVRIDEVE